MAEHSRNWPNITFKTEEAPKRGTLIQWHNVVFRDVVYALCEANPTWKFVMYKPPPQPYGKVTIFHVDVYLRGEKLGAISGEVNRKAYGVCIQHTKKNTNTKDIKRALANIKKLFVPATMTEKMDQAADKADTMLGNMFRSEDMKARTLTRTLEADMALFTRTVWPQFIEFMQAKYGTAKIVATYEAQMEVMLSIKNVRDKFLVGVHALIVADDGKYIVRIADGVTLYDADKLPEGLRGKLGLLKLVDIGALVSGIGCRVNEETFIVMLDGDMEITNES